MPINVSALSSPESDDRTPEEIAGKVAHDDLAEQPPSEAAAAALSGATNENEDVTAEPAKRARRTKAQLIADAVVPGNDDKVELKDVATGAKIERTWLVALEMVRDKKAEFADKGMKYAMLKHDQQKVAGAFAQPSEGPASQEPMVAADTGEPSAQTPSPATDVSGQPLAPEGAEVGDEVIIGVDTYYVGHGKVIVDGLVGDEGEIIQPRRRWQRELGAGPDGPWESRLLVQTVSAHPQAGPIQEPSVPIEQAEAKLAVEQAISPPQNGKADLDAQTERLPRTVEEVEPGTLKIGTGMLDKIGLPDYSSLQIGPITMSRTVQDDGRRHTETVKGRQVTVITAAVEAFEELDNTIEFVGARFRGQLQSFLEATGALKQPVA